MSKRRTKFSIASFLSSVFIIPIVSEISAITFGVIALRRIHKNHQVLKGESLAIAGIIIATLRLLFLATVMVLVSTISPQLKPNLLEIGQNVKIAKAHVDFLQIEEAIEEYYKEHKKIPKSLVILKENGFIKELPQDPFSKDKNFYRYKAEKEARILYPKADFLIYSLGPDGDDDEAIGQYLSQDKDGDIIKIGHIKKLRK